MAIGVARMPGDAATGPALARRLAQAFERVVWKRRGLKEGWHRVAPDTIRAGALRPGRPTTSDRSLLLLHGPLSSAAASFRDLADRILQPHHAYLRRSRVRIRALHDLRTPEENARMLLEGLPDRPTTFDVVAYSRGGLVLRTLVERADALGRASARFRLGQAVLVAVPNEGTPLADPNRWAETIGWLANLLEMFPDNPFSSGAAFVANAIVWMANQAGGELPGFHAMSPEGPVIEAIQGPPGPPLGVVLRARRQLSSGAACLAAVSRCRRRSVVRELERSRGARRRFVARRSYRPDVRSSLRIGCFGPGGNIAAQGHVDALQYLCLQDRRSTSSSMRSPMRHSDWARSTRRRRCRIADCCVMPPTAPARRRSRAVPALQAKNLRPRAWRKHRCA